MANAVNDKCDKLLQAVTSHESLLPLGSRPIESTIPGSEFIMEAGSWWEALSRNRSGWVVVSTMCFVVPDSPGAKWSSVIGSRVLAYELYTVLYLVFVTQLRTPGTMLFELHGYLFTIGSDP